MYEKQKSIMDTSELIFANEISTAASTMFVETSSMAFTPTTLAAFEELSSALITSQAIPSDVLVSESSGNQFLPGTATYSTVAMFGMDDDSSLDSNSNITASSDANRSGTFSMANVQATKTAQQQREICAVKPVEQKQRKLPGPRPSKPIEEMTPIEAERRRRRRERNKNAAAKCRQRRLEVTNELLAETQKLEKEASKLEREIENLRRVKDQLEFVLESHKPICTAMPPVTDSDFILDSSVIANNSSLIAAAATISNVCVVRPNNLPLPSFSGAGSTATFTSASQEGVVFSFDTPTALAGLTPLLSVTGDLSSPSTFNLFSP